MWFLKIKGVFLSLSSGLCSCLICLWKKSKKDFSRGRFLVLVIGDIIKGNWEISFPYFGVISLMWLTYNKGCCDEVSSSGGTHWGFLWLSSSVICWGNAWELPRTQTRTLYFPFPDENITFGCPSLPDVTNPQDSKKYFWRTVFSKGFQAYKRRYLIFLYLFKWYKKTVPMRQQYSKILV